MTMLRTRRGEHTRLKPLIDFAVQEGWKVACMPPGHLKLTKRGLPPIYTSATTDDVLGPARDRLGYADRRTTGNERKGRRR